MPTYKILDVRTREEVTPKMWAPTHTSAEKFSAFFNPAIYTCAVLLPEKEVAVPTKTKKRARKK